MLWTPPKSNATIATISQAVSRSVSLSLSRRAVGRVGRLAGQPVSQSVSWSVDQLVSRSVGQPADQPVGQSVGQSGGPAGQWVSQSVSQSVSRSVSQLVRQSVSWLVGRSVSQSVNSQTSIRQNGMAVLTRKPFFKLATYGVRLLISGGTEAERKRYFFWLLLLSTVQLNLTSLQAYVFSFRFASLQVLKQMSLIATQRSSKTSRWNSLLKKRSPKWRSNPKELSVIFPRASATLSQVKRREKRVKLIRNIPVSADSR